MLRLHQALNPFIYGFGDKHMRNESIKLVCRKFTILSYAVFNSFKKQPELGNKLLDLGCLKSGNHISESSNTNIHLNIVTVCTNIDHKSRPKILHMDPL